MAGSLRDHDPGRFAVQRGFDNDSLRLTLVANGTQGEFDIDVRRVEVFYDDQVPGLISQGYAVGPLANLLDV